MLTEIDRTRHALSQGPLYANWNSKEPRRVWVIEHKSYAYHALETKPVDGFPGLVWALVEAMSVSRSRGGVSVTFWRSGATGWYPLENVALVG